LQQVSYAQLGWLLRRGDFGGGRSIKAFLLNNSTALLREQWCRTRGVTGFAALLLLFCSKPQDGGVAVVPHHTKAEQVAAFPYDYERWAGSSIVT
jgi:hypothetical protein